MSYVGFCFVHVTITENFTTLDKKLIIANQLNSTQQNKNVGQTKPNFKQFVGNVFFFFSRFILIFEITSMLSISQREQHKKSFLYAAGDRYISLCISGLFLLQAFLHNLMLCHAMLKHLM